MINELTVYKDAFGSVIRVEATLIEGNADSPGQVRNIVVFHDLLSLTPAGPDFLSGHKKILGFGVDLSGVGRRFTIRPGYTTYAPYPTNE